MARKRFKGGVIGAGPAAAIELSDEILEALGGKRVPVKVTINGFTFRTTTSVMGGQQFIGFSKANREACKIHEGQQVTVTIENDTEPRIVEPPSELSAAFKKVKAAKATWDRLSYTHQREYAEWITGAKKPETRQRRANKAIEMLTDGVKTPG